MGVTTTDTAQNVHRPRKGKKYPPKHPKGRQVDGASLGAVQAALGDVAHTRDLLIENLHVLQDTFGGLYRSHLVALADIMNLAMAEVYEVATFYAHFHILDDHDAPADITVRICNGPACQMADAKDILHTIIAKTGDNIRVVPAPCVGRCDTAPVAEVGHNHITSATTDSVLGAIANNDTHAIASEGRSLSTYRQDGGYRVLQSCLSGDLSFEDILKTLETSGLRGMGGAGFPSGLKWKFVRAEQGPRFIAVNADEGEPGTFKDRHILSTQPHRVLEGALIAAWAMEAGDVYIYLRDEYPDIRLSLQHAIADVQNTKLGQHTKIHLRRGAGAYICGEESAMLESIEGKRGIPRQKPPFPSQVGLFGQPTLIHNVETLYWVPEILDKGADWFANSGKPGHKGLKHFSVSGRVKNPGVKQAPAGTTLRELIDDHCGGMADGHRLKGYMPGGASGGILPASLDDVPLDFGQLEQYGCFVGSSAVVVLSDQDNIATLAREQMEFFEDESCGQCTPCRIGTEKAAALMKSEAWDVEVLSNLCDAMADASICGLGQAAPNPLRSVIRHFPDDVPGAKK